MTKCIYFVLRIFHVFCIFHVVFHLVVTGYAALLSSSVKCKQIKHILKEKQCHLFDTCIPFSPSTRSLLGFKVMFNTMFVSTIDCI